MTNVFVVTQREWDDVEVVGVFATMEQANEFISRMETNVERVNCTIWPQEVK